LPFYSFQLHGGLIGFDIAKQVAFFTVSPTFLSRGDNPFFMVSLRRHEDHFFYFGEVHCLPGGAAAVLRRSAFLLRHFPEPVEGAWELLFYRRGRVGATPFKSPEMSSPGRL